MIYLYASIGIQILCAVHVIRAGRNPAWLMVIIFLSLIGCLAYFLFEIAPTLGGNRHVRQARAAAVRTLDPERELRAARDQLDLADTAANRTRVADALAGLGRFREAVPIYEEAIARAPGPDRRLSFKLARAAFETGQSERTLALIAAAPETLNGIDADQAELLRARALEGVGRYDEALAVYAEVAPRLAGGEARCRYANLLLENGRRQEATAVLTEVENGARRLTRQQRALDGEMYRWAEDKLRELRAS